MTGEDVVHPRAPRDPGRRVDPCTTIRVAHTRRSSGTVRAAMRAELRTAEVRRSVIDDAELVLGELVANAVEHGQPDERGQIEVSWCLEDEVLRLSVLDGGDVGTLGPLELTDASLRGRGLALVDHLCDAWRHDHEHGTRVTAELDFTSTG